MPSRHTVKQYSENSYYHVFNRGVEKRDIFMDNSDYEYFLSLLDRYLSKREKSLRRRESPSYFGRLDLAAYCLMSNHFHLLVYQYDKEAMESFMRSLSTSYSMYFNKKYDRVGKLFQGRYKAVHVNKDGYFTHISRYIHLNPIDAGKNYQDYRYSSYASWVSDMIPKEPWLKSEEARAIFTNGRDYAAFVADYILAKKELDGIKKSLKA